tara:strand:+ start:109 stop:741 length:633 start_codon:yes stop_codon:yes gene_type:complete
VTRIDSARYLVDEYMPNPMESFQNVWSHRSDAKFETDEEEAEFLAPSVDATTATLVIAQYSSSSALPQQQHPSSPSEDSSSPSSSKFDIRQKALYAKYLQTHVTPYLNTYLTKFFNKHIDEEWFANSFSALRRLERVNEMRYSGGEGWNPPVQKADYTAAKVDHYIRSYQPQPEPFNSPEAAIEIFKEAKDSRDRKEFEIVNAEVRERAL